MKGANEGMKKPGQIKPAQTHTQTTPSAPRPNTGQQKPKG